MRSIRKFLWAVLKGYKQDDCSQHAAVISFYAIFSLLPLAMIAVTILASLLGGSTEWTERLEALVTGVLPAASDELHRILDTAVAKRQGVSLVSAGMLVVLASFLVSALERALDRVFRTEKKRNYFHSKVLALGFVFIFVLLFATPGLLHLAQQGLSLLGFPYFKADFLSGNAFFFFVAFSAFFLAVTVIPHRKVYMRFVVWGSLAFTLLTGVVRLFFRYYIYFYWGRYNFIYGSLTVLIVLIVWIFYLVNIFLLCAELVARLQDNRSH